MSSAVVVGLFGNIRASDPHAGAVERGRARRAGARGGRQQPAQHDPGSAATDAETSEAAATPGVGEQVELEGSPEFERKLAELAFALYLGNELDVDAGTYSCTEPPSLSVGETITCFTLIGSERVVVAETELTGTSGVYVFELISDHRIDAGEAMASADSTSTLPTPILVTTSAPVSRADADLLAYGEQINASSEELVDNLISGEDGVVERADYSWDGRSATVALSATLSPASTNGVDTAAWIIARDRAIDLWGRDSPFRAEGTTIRPSLDITINDVRYVSDFDLCVRVADQTIAMTDWIAESQAS